jgi:hypothetical protein
MQEEPTASRPPAEPASRPAGETPASPPHEPPAPPPEPSPVSPTASAATTPGHDGDERPARRSPLSGETLFSLALVVVFGWAVWESRNWPLQARLFPWVVGVPMTLLALLQLTMDLRGVEQARSGFETEFGVGMDPSAVRRRIAAIVGWMVGFYVLIMLIGFIWAVPLGIFLYLKFGSGENWPLSVGLAAAGGLAFFGLFGQVLNTPFPEGLLFSLLSPD